MPSQFALRHAARVVHAGGLIAYPTEAVYGLGCDPQNGEAVARLLVLKQRPMSMGLILIAASLDQLEPYLGRVSRAQRRTLTAPTTAPVTWVVPCADDTPGWLTGDHESIAVRITQHPAAHALCIQCDQALVSTSANISGLPAARTALAVRQRFGDHLGAIVTGAVGNRCAPPTTIRDLISGEVLR